MLGVDVEVRALSGWSAPNNSTRSPTSSTATRSAAPSAACTACWRIWRRPSPSRTDWRPRRPADVTVAANRVQVLTVHAAKGLEWQLVAVPHLSGRIFPSTASARTWLTDAGDLPPLLRGDRAPLGEHGVPVLDTSTVTNRKQLSDNITGHRDQLAQRRIDEERRLLYVAITRAEDTLLLSGHQWGSHRTEAPRAVGLPARGPRRSSRPSAATGRRPAARWTSGRPHPADGEPNPLRDNVIEGVWPAAAAAGPTVGPASRCRAGRRRGAASIAEPQTAPGPTRTGGPPRSTRCWPSGRRAPHRQRPRCRPSCRSAASSSWAATARPPSRGCTGGCRLVPTHTRCWAPLFTTGCNGSTAPSGSSTSTTCPAPSTGTWAARTPRNSPNCRPRSWRRRGPRGHRSTSRCPSRWSIGEHIVRGRIDAVFADADGGVTVVDWKTGAAPAGATPPAGRGPARRVPAGVGGAAWVPGVRGPGGLPLCAQRRHRRSRRAAGPRRTRRPAAAARMRVTARRRA